MNRLTRIISFVTIALTTLFQTVVSVPTIKQGFQSISEIKKQFVNPPSEYRSMPLWDWNEQITKEGIEFQMKEFKRAGIGGVFVHPRPGLLIEYLSKEWFQLFDYAVQCGKKMGLNVWMYDENSFPSGFAGGHLPAEMPDSYQHGTGLIMQRQNVLNITFSDTVAVVLKKVDTAYVDITSSVAQELGKAGEYIIFRKTYPPKEYWYGGFSYVDLLYPGVTDKFIEITMKRGYERNQNDFGKTVSGIFCDEPNLEAAMPSGSLVRWTPDLFPTFQQRWGYDLRTNLPSLVEEIGDWKKVRHDYYELILELFVNRWAKPWSKYCDQNKLTWTGHYWEHGWPEPSEGSDESAFYIWHQMPGVDMLGNRLDTVGLGEQFGNDRAIRELRSAANQAGKTRTMSETYGGGGWEMSFEKQKQLVDWEVVLGVNFVIQHLSYYSINGVRKYDFPPSFSYHEPWWSQYKMLGDYIGRISMAMSAGEQLNQTLVMQPNTTAWMYFSRKVKNEAIASIRKGFKNFVYRLEQQHLEYDLGSENVLKTLGSVVGDTLKVGKRDYKLVVLPAEMETIDQSTYQLIEKFIRNGGKVLSFAKQISMIDGTPSTKLADLVAKHPANWIFAESLNDAKAMNLLRRAEFSMNDQSKNGMLYHQRRELNDGQIIFVANSHPTKKASATIAVNGKQVICVDLVSGKSTNYPAKMLNGKLTFQVSLVASGSALFLVSKQQTDMQNETAVTTSTTEVHPTQPMRIKLESDNVLIVNYLDLKTAKEEKKDIYYMKAQLSLFKDNGIALGNPWQNAIQYKKNYLEMDSVFSEKSGFEAKYHFQINENISTAMLKTICAVVERPEVWRVSINGKVVTKMKGEYWIDKDFPRYRIGEYLKLGENTLTITASRMHILGEVMPIFLLGDFHVKPTANGFEIAAANELALGSWRDAGMPFYSQKVAYSQHFNVNKKQSKSFKVVLKNWKGTVAEVCVNRKSVGSIGWQPYELDVTKALKEGDNEISIKVTGSLKNTFGFFYQHNRSWIFGPWSWNSAPINSPSASEYFLMDYGLYEPFKLLKLN